MINEQTDVQIASRERQEADWEEVRHAHTHTHWEKHTHADVQSLLFLVIPRIGGGEENARQSCLLLIFCKSLLHQILIQPLPVVSLTPQRGEPLCNGKKKD